MDPDYAIFVDHDTVATTTNKDAAARRAAAVTQWIRVRADHDLIEAAQLAGPPSLHSAWMQAAWSVCV